ncbi:tetratricopeptide repeat protein [Zemynaea arenosa]|nr:tetratricopeptide repeat protein [Massilia arenosa]
MKTWLCLLLAVTLAGCASTTQQRTVAPAPPSVIADSAFGPPAHPVQVDDLFAVSPAMREFLNTGRFRNAVKTKGVELALAEALYRSDDLQLVYDTTITRNAADTFATRSGNCLALVIMTAAFAKELGMQVTFQNVMIGDTWTRADDLYLSNLHVNVMFSHNAHLSEVFSTAAPVIVDFVPPQDVMGFRTRRVPESMLVAMFLNNRAAEELSAGRVNDAYWWARKAVTEHPDFVTAFNTLGVIYQRRGEVQLAERSFKEALDRDPQHIVAMYNLLALLRAEHRTEEAELLAGRVKSIEKDPPFYFFEQGMDALNRGNFPVARAMFQREVQRAPYYDEFHFWLGIANLRLGDVKAARQEMALAESTSSTPEARRTYSAKLAHMRAMKGSDQ